MGDLLSNWFVNPAFLLGAGAAAIPFILHMVYRRRAPKIFFSTLRFIRASAERTARRRRIRDWILLLLRAGAIFLLVTALAGPIFRGAGSGGDNAAVALVMDNSYSMAAEWEQTSAYARARDFAVQILGGLPADSQAAVTYACPPPGHTQLADLLTSDRNGLAEEVGRSEVSAVGGDLAGAIDRAEKLLKNAPSDQREIYVFTDLQRIAWRELPQPKSGRTPMMVIVDCGSGEMENVAVSAVHHTALRPAVGVPLTLQVRVRNFGARPAQGKALLYLDGKKSAERALKVNPRAETELSFGVTFKTAGTHTGWVGIEVNDILPLDNRRFFAIDIPQRIRVAVVREKEGPVPQLDDAFFIVPALNPSAAGMQVSSAIAPEKLLRSDLTPAKLTKYAVVYLVNLQFLTDQQLRAVAEYLAAGGSLAIFPGDDLKPDKWNPSTVPSKRELMPAAFGELLPQNGESEEAVPLDRETVDFNHVVFAPFARMDASFFTDVTAARYYDLQLREGAGARVLARLANGKPFLVEKAAGKGRGKVMLFCTTATTQWTNLPARRLFLPLLHQVTYYLARTRRAPESVAPGRSVVFPGTSATGRPGAQDTTAGFEVTDPLGVTKAATTPSAAEGPASYVYADTARPGIYTWTRRAEHAAEAGPERGAFVVNLNTTEGDLATVDQETLSEKMLPGRKAHFARSAEEAHKIAMRLREGVRLRTPLLFFVIAVLLMECIMANQVRAQKRDRSSRISGLGPTVA